MCEKREEDSERKILIKFLSLLLWHRKVIELFDTCCKRWECITHAVHMVLDDDDKFSVKM